MRPLQRGREGTPRSPTPTIPHHLHKRRLSLAGSRDALSNAPVPPPRPSRLPPRSRSTLAASPCRPCVRVAAAPHGLSTVRTKHRARERATADTRSRLGHERLSLSRPSRVARLSQAIQFSSSVVQHIQTALLLRQCCVVASPSLARCHEGRVAPGKRTTYWRAPALALVE